MARSNLQKDLDAIFNLTVGEKGDKKVIRTLRRILNRAESTVTVDSKAFSADLEKHYRARTGKSPSDAVKARYQALGEEVVRDWASTVKSNKTMELVSKTASKIVFIIKEKDNVGKSGSVSSLRDNYKLFQRENQKIVQPLIKSKYHQLFKGESYKRTKTGHIRAIGDVGHDYSVTEKGRGGVAAGMLDNLLEGDFDNPNDRDEVQKIKDGFIDVGLKATEVLKISGSGRTMRSSTAISLSLEGSTANRQKSADDKKAGDKIKEYISDAITKGKGNISSGKNYVNKEGSTPFIDQVGEAIVNTPLKMASYKKRKARNLTKYKLSVKNTNTEKKVSKSRQIKGQRQNITGGGVDSVMVASLTKGQRQATPKKTDFAQTIRGLLKVKRAINARLPAEVRRNMGKPGLTNRTGRFSNSAEVTQILPAAQTLMVKYTYRLNPYETYENTGKKRWPAGYNPKPLIAKSIRGLALGLIDEKLTIRRG